MREDIIQPQILQLQQHFAQLTAMILSLGLIGYPVCSSLVSVVF